MGNPLVQTPYHVTNFTPLSNNLPNSYNVSGQNSPPPTDLGSRSKLPQGEYVIETFKLGSRY